MTHEGDPTEDVMAQTCSPERSEAVMPARTEAPPPRRRIVAALPYLLDLVVPLVSYYALTAAGLSSFWALVAGGSLTGVSSVANTIRRRRLDGLGLLVIAEIGLGLALIATTRDPRLVLARGSLYLALAGIWVLASAFTRHPVTIDATRPFAARKGERGLVAFEWLTANSDRFLRIHRRVSAVWGLMFIAYAAVRIVIIYSTTVSRAVSLTEIPGIVAIGICLIVSKRAGTRLEALVGERMAESDADEVRP
jgi:hypothetical protein